MTIFSVHFHSNHCQITNCQCLNYLLPRIFQFFQKIFRKIFQTDFHFNWDSDWGGVKGWREMVVEFINAYTNIFYCSTISLSRIHHSNLPPPPSLLVLVWLSLNINIFILGRRYFYHLLSSPRPPSPGEVKNETVVSQWPLHPFSDSFQMIQ